MDKKKALLPQGSEPGTDGSGVIGETISEYNRPSISSESYVPPKIVDAGDAGTIVPDHSADSFTMYVVKGETRAEYATAGDYD